MVWNDKQRYFQKRRYPYFGRLERVLKKCGVSYGGKYDPEGRYSHRLACSMDLAQWHTNPLWGHIPQEAQAKLLQDGRPFVELILERNPSIKLLLGNGQSVVRNVEQAFSVRLENCGQVEGIRLFMGQVRGVTFIGWNRFLSSPPGLTVTQMEALGERVARLAGPPFACTV